MRQVYVNGYWRGNLGDDLFLRMLTARYPDVAFHIHAVRRYRAWFRDRPNLLVHATDWMVSPFGRRLDVVLRRITRDRTGLEELAKRRCLRGTDAFVVLGGSVFIETAQWIRKYRLYRDARRRVPFLCVLGANFGPWRTDLFLSSFREIFRACDDVCFRDHASLALFPQAPACRVAPDLVFALDVPAGQRSKTLALSIRSMAGGMGLAAWCEPYQRKMAELVHVAVGRGYGVDLLAFCPFERDEEAAADLLDRLAPADRVHVRCHAYHGDIDAMLSVLAAAERIVATRFHAMVLGFCLNRPTLPVAYSDKMTQTMREIGYDGPCVPLAEIGALDPEAVFSLPADNRLDLASLRRGAQRHFERLDAYLGSGGRA